MDSSDTQIKLNEIPASATPATPDASVTPAITEPISPASDTPAAPASDTLASPKPANVQSLQLAPRAPPTVVPGKEFSWNEMEVGMEVMRTKHSLAHRTNAVMLAMFVLLTIASIVQGQIDKPWNLIYLWIGAIIGWVLRDRKDPKRHDND